MIAYRYKFADILTVREQEKTEIELAYKESVVVFEKIATELFELLKKKEETMDLHIHHLTQGLAITHIHHYTNYMDGLQKNIDLVQKDVAQARSKMEWFKERLVDKMLEVRKFEKINEVEYERYYQEQQRLEAIQLDEISSLQFQKKRLGE